MAWTNISLESNLIQLFHNLVKNNCLAHAYIFYGPKNSHKKQAAYEFSKAINCERKQADACDHCPTCLKIKHGNHPDIVTIEPQGTGIKIDQLRELRKKFHYQAPSGFTRIVVIEHAEQMRLEAANSLLKFLEEPPSPMVALLLTENVQTILPTIQSRCQKVRFKERVITAQLADYQKQGFPQHLAQIAAQYSYPLDLAHQAFDELCQQTITWADQILSGRREEMMITLLQLVHNTPEVIPLILDNLLFWCRELIHFSITNNIQYYAHWAAALKRQSTKQTTESLMLIIENIMIARRLLDKPGLAPQAVLEQMILAIQHKKLSQKNGWQLITI